MGQKSAFVLPAELFAALGAIGDRLKQQRPIDGSLDTLLQLLDELPAGVVARAEGAIRSAAWMRAWRDPEPRLFDRFLGAGLTDLDQLERQPGLKRVFIFHRDGRMREAALRKMVEALPSPFAFAAVAWRLNDWAEPVRKAAVECARRIFPLTSGEVIARAATELLGRGANWRRWRGERAVLDEAFARADVAARLADAIAGMRTGSAAAILRHALRRDGLDPHLERLAREARQPGVRALALETLIDGHASLPNGFDWQWIDKPMGIRRRIPAYERRTLVDAPPRRATIELGLADGSALVRKKALDGLILYRTEIPQASRLVAALAADPAATVRERAEFVLRTEAKPA